MLQRPTGSLGVEGAGAGNIIKLDAFQNDVLHALMQTGGLPGVSSKNEVQIIRSNSRDKQARLEFMRQYSEIAARYANDPCNCPPPMPDDPTITRIPLRLLPGEVPTFTEEDIILQDGDVVLIETRETEFSSPAVCCLAASGHCHETMTWMPWRDGHGGLWSGTFEHGQRGFAGTRLFAGRASGRLYVLRPSVCGKDQIAIEVDLAKAVNDPRQRPIIRPGDTLILAVQAVRRGD